MPGQSVAYCEISYRAEKIRLLPNRLRRPFRRFGVTAGNEMGERGQGLHQKHEWIKRAQTHGPRQVLDCDVGLAEKSSDPSTSIPRCRQIRIEHECSIDQGCASLQVSGDISKRKPAGGERHRIILAAFGYPPSQPCGF